MFNEQIGDELDVRGATKTAPNKTAEELEQEEKDKGYIVRKNKKGEKNKDKDKKKEGTGKKQPKIGGFAFQEAFSKDKSYDLFKDLIDRGDEKLVKEDKSKWVNYKLRLFKLEKNQRKIHNLIKSK